MKRKLKKRKKTKEPGGDSEVYRTFLRSIINSIIRFAANMKMIVLVATHENETGGIGVC